MPIDFFGENPIRQALFLIQSPEAILQILLKELTFPENTPPPGQNPLGSPYQFLKINIPDENGFIQNKLAQVADLTFSNSSNLTPDQQSYVLKSLLTTSILTENTLDKIANFCFLHYSALSIASLSDLLALLLSEPKSLKSIRVSPPPLSLGYIFVYSLDTQDLSSIPRNRQGVCTLLGNNLFRMTETRKKKFLRSNPWVAPLIANIRNLDTLEILIELFSSEIRYSSNSREIEPILKSLISNPLTPPATLLLALQRLNRLNPREIDSSISSILARKDLSQEILLRMYTLSDNMTKKVLDFYEATQNPIPISVQKKMLQSSKTFFIREALSRQTSLDPKIIKSLVHDSLEIIRILSLTNPNCPPDLLAEAIKNPEAVSEDANTIKKILGNPNFPIDVLRKNSAPLPPDVFFNKSAEQFTSKELEMAFDSDDYFPALASLPDLPSDLSNRLLDKVLESPYHYSITAKNLAKFSQNASVLASLINLFDQDLSAPLLENPIFFQLPLQSQVDFIQKAPVWAVIQFAQRCDLALTTTFINALSYFNIFLKEVVKRPDVSSSLLSSLSNFVLNSGSPVDTSIINDILSHPSLSDQDYISLAARFPVSQRAAKERLLRLGRDLMKKSDEAIKLSSSAQHFLEQTLENHDIVFSDALQLALLVDEDNQILISSLGPSLKNQGLA